MAVVLAACSDSALETADGMQATDGEERYPISLSASGSSMEISKAAINSNPNGSFRFENTKDTMGVLMLATGLTPLYKTQGGDGSNWPADVSWSNSGDSLNGPASEIVAVLANAPAQVIYSNDSKTGSVIDFFGSAELYPLGSMHKYSFYAYHPRTSSLRYFQNSVKAVFTKLDGTKDVITGYAVPDASDSYINYAWSAEYWRHFSRMSSGSRAMEAYTPVLPFRHEFMQLMFKMVAGGLPTSEPEDTLRSYDEAYNTRLVALSILNVPDTVTVVVADRNATTSDRATIGQMAYSSTRNTKYLLHQYKKVGSGYAEHYNPDSLLEAISPRPKYTEYKEAADTMNFRRDYTNVPDTVLLGCPQENTSLRQGIILPVLSEDDRLNNPYRLQVVLEYPAGSGKYYYNEPIILYSKPNQSFQPGYSYEITLKIYGPGTVEAEAVRTNWVSITEQDLDKYVSNKK